MDGRVGPDTDRAPSPVDPGPSPGVVAVTTPPRLTAVTPARAPQPPPKAVTHTAVPVSILNSTLLKRMLFSVLP